MRDLFEEADGAGVVDELDESAVPAVGDDGVGPDPDLDVLFLVDFVDEADELHGHVLLAQVVA